MKMGYFLENLFDICFYVIMSVLLMWSISFIDGQPFMACAREGIILGIVIAAINAVNRRIVNLEKKKDETV
jgi:hypothetical protein